ncbi:MAG TPA: hypothetical protein VG432_04710 [Gemmatimonadaceae bacterium]|nr:hypothetical protein [Gemmatimonadaceae bacterium]
MSVNLHNIQRAGALALLLLGAAGCADDAATAPSSTPRAAPPRVEMHRETYQQGPRLPDAADQSRVAQCSHREKRIGTAVIGPRGGVLRVGNNYLAVPAGALDAQVRIVGEVVVGEMAAIRFEPEGLRFARPATLLLDAHGCDIGREERPALLYLDDNGSTLERIDARYDPASAQLTAPIVHFSVYAVGV